MKCKVGDLAIIIRPHVEANLGALVEIVSPDEEPGCWWVRSLSGPMRRNDDSVSSEAAIEDSGLWPIRGRRRKVQKAMVEAR